MKLFRRSLRPLGSKPNEFWTDSRTYPRYIQRRGTTYSADISASAVVRTFGTSPNARDLRRLKAEGVDIAVYPIWDWYGSEFVVLNRHALVNVRRLETP